MSNKDSPTAKLADAIIMSFWISGAILGLIDEATEHNQWLTMHIDCTVRVRRQIRGQVDYRAKAEVRNAALFPDGVACRKLLIILGRTCTVGGIVPVHEDTSEDVAAAIGEHMPEAARAQAEFVFCDNPPGKLLTCLLKPLLKLRFLATDPQHTAFNFTQAKVGATRRSKFWAKLINKFNRIHPSMSRGS